MQGLRPAFGQREHGIVVGPESGEESKELGARVRHVHGDDGHRLERGPFQARDDARERTCTGDRIGNLGDTQPGEPRAVPGGDDDLLACVPQTTEHTHGELLPLEQEGGLVTSHARAATSGEEHPRDSHRQIFVVFHGSGRI